MDGARGETSLPWEARVGWEGNFEALRTAEAMNAKRYTYGVVLCINTVIITIYTA